MVRRSRSQKIRLFCSLCFKLQAAGKNLLIHYQRKIVELSRQGVRKVSQMRRHLEADVKTAGIGGHQLALNEVRRRFQPTNKDIYNHMYQARMAQRFSKLDQENVDALIVKWKKEKTSADAFHFRPPSSDVAAVNDACNSLINDKDDIMSDEVPILNYWPLIKTACFSVTKQLIKGRFKKVRGSIVSHGCHLSHYKICPAL